jgi:hypothetical protein
VTHNIADGDLTQSMATQRGDKFGLLLCAVDDMNSRLRNQVGQVRNGAESVATASAEIAQGNNDRSLLRHLQPGAIHPGSSNSLFDVKLCSNGGTTHHVDHPAVAAHHQAFKVVAKGAVVRQTRRQRLDHARRAYGFLATNAAKRLRLIQHNPRFCGRFER